MAKVKAEPATSSRPSFRVVVVVVDPFTMAAVPAQVQTVAVTAAAGIRIPYTGEQLTREEGQDMAVVLVVPRSVPRAAAAERATVSGAAATAAAARIRAGKQPEHRIRVAAVAAERAPLGALTLPVSPVAKGCSVFDTLTQGLSVRPEVLTLPADQPKVTTGFGTFSTVVVICRLDYVTTLCRTGSR